MTGKQEKCAINIIPWINVKSNVLINFPNLTFFRFTKKILHLQTYELFLLSFHNFNDYIDSWLSSWRHHINSCPLLSAPLGAAGGHHHRPAAAAARRSTRRRHGDAPGRGLQPAVPHGETSAVFMRSSVPCLLQKKNAQKWSFLEALSRSNVGLMKKREWPISSIFNPYKQHLLHLCSSWELSSLCPHGVSMEVCPPLLQGCKDRGCHVLYTL